MGVLKWLISARKNVSTNTCLILLCFTLLASVLAQVLFRCVAIIFRRFWAATACYKWDILSKNV